MNILEKQNQGMRKHLDAFIGQFIEFLDQITNRLKIFAAIII